MTQRHMIPVTFTRDDMPTLRQVLIRLQEEADQEQDQIAWDMIYADLATARNTIALHLDGADYADLNAAKDLITRAITALHNLGTAPKELKR